MRWMLRIVLALGLLAAASCGGASAPTVGTSEPVPIELPGVTTATYDQVALDVLSLE